MIVNVKKQAKAAVTTSVSKIRYQSKQKTHLGLTDTSRNINQRHVLTDHLFFHVIDVFASHTTATKKNDYGCRVMVVSAAFVQNNMMSEHKRIEKEGSDAYLFLACSHL